MFPSHRWVVMFLCSAVTVSAIGTAHHTQLPGRRLSPELMALVVGGTGSQKGSGFYSCDDLAAQGLGAGYTSQYGCEQLKIVPPGLKCVRCPSDVASGRSLDANGNSIAFNKNVTCSSQRKIANCINSVTGHGFCDSEHGDGQNCSGTWAQYNDE